MAILSQSDMEKIGFASVGENVLISDRASFYGAAKISIGNHVRIDDFCVISAGLGGVVIGNYVHIAVASTLIGAGAISIADFVNISSKVSIYSSSDDYSGTAMAGPMLPPEFTNFDVSPVQIARHAIIGAGSVLLPGALLDEGVAVGALSLIKGHCKAFGIYAGSPARRIMERRRDLLKLEESFLTRK
ncbi:MAG: acyltransferase [Hydrogenophaga sp.]|nr:acyltransferase [Hydrogenophaga sp.]